MSTLGCQRDLFDLPDDVTYFNMAYQSPLLKSTVEAGEQGLRRKLRPYEITKDDFFDPLENVKSLFAQLIDCDDAQRIAYHPSVSYGIATIVRNLVPRAGCNIVVLAEQFPSNALEYIDFCKKNNIELRTVYPSNDISERSIEWNKAILAAIDEHTICVSIPHCHWSDGTVFDLEAIRIHTKRHSALLIVDGTQSVGAMPFSIAKIQPDALITAVYKFLLGPYGSTLAYYGPYFDGKEPIEQSWMNRLASDQFHRLSEYSSAFRPGAYRYNVGECANFIALPMIADSLRQILQWQPKQIQSYCKSIFVTFDQELLEHGFQMASASQRASHLFGIYPPSEIPADLLLQRLKENDIYVSQRGRFLRIAAHLYNSKSDVAKLTTTLLRSG